MRQTRLGDLPDVFQISIGRGLAERLAVFDEEEEGQDLGEARKGREDEGVLVAHVLDPRRQAVPDGKGHGVSDDDDGDHGLAGQVAVRVDAVADAELEPDRVGEGDDSHCPDLRSLVSEVFTHVIDGTEKSKRQRLTKPNHWTW